MDYTNLLYSLKIKNVPHLDTEIINYYFNNFRSKDKQYAHRWRNIITTSAMEKCHYNFSDGEI